MPTYLTEAQFYKYARPASRYLNVNRAIRGWAVHAGSVYKSGQTGAVGVLYENSNDLGAPEAALNDVDANGEWFYDSTIDTAYLFNDGNSPNLDDILAGEDHATFVADIFERASLLIDRELDAKHEIPLQKDADANYEELIIQITAYKVAELITAIDAPELSLQYSAMLANEEETGLLDRLSKGTLKFSYEIDSTSSLGQITEKTLTGTIRLVELRGTASGIPWDDIKVIITGAGALGTATYSTYVFDANNNTLQTLIQITDVVVNGQFQDLAYGVQGRFEGAEAAEDDEWSVVVRGVSEETSNATIKTRFGGRS